MEPIEIGLVAIASHFLTKYAEKTAEGLAEGLGEKTLTQVDKFWQLIQRKPVETFPALKSAETQAFPVDFERAIQELETAANEDSEVRQAIIDVVAVAQEENPEYVEKIGVELEEKTNLPGVTAERINTLLQGNTISGGVSNTGDNTTGVFQHNTISISGDFNN